MLKTSLITWSMMFSFATLSFVPTAQAKIPLNKPFPSAKIPLLDGKGALDAAAMKGKVVVVDFWASWCTPCKEELPALNALYKKIKGKKVEIIGINGDEDIKNARDFLKQYPVSFPIVYDGVKKQLIKKIEDQGVPVTFVLDKKGVVRFFHSGFKSGDFEKLEKEVAQLLAEK